MREQVWPIACEDIESTNEQMFTYEIANQRTVEVGNSLPEGGVWIDTVLCLSLLSLVWIITEYKA